MAFLNRVNKSSRFLVILMSIVIFSAISLFFLVGIQEQMNVSEIEHVINSDLKQMELEFGIIGENNAISAEIVSHVKNHLQTSRFIYSVILFAILLLSFAWMITIIHLRRLRSIRAYEQQLEELLYYNQVSEIHETSPDSKKFPDSIRELQNNRSAFIAELKNAIEKNQFVLHYQPIVNSQTGKIIDTEALIRWQHPVYGLLSPDTFLPLCEHTGLAIPLGEWVFKTACKQISEWREMGFSQLHMSINLSTLQLNDPDLLSMITNCLTKNNLPPDALKLEITENSLMKDIQASTEILQSISHLGIQLSLDDFGTGYSSLQYLKHLPISNLKIDTMFVKDMSTNITSFGIVESVIVLGKSLGLTITAEGVENSNHLHILKKMGCDLLQGYFYSEPVSSAVFTDLLNKDENTHAGKMDNCVGEANRYHYDVLKNEHYHQAVNVITNAFCEDEPMTKHLGITAAEFVPFAKIMVDKAVQNGLSMVAIDNNEVIACTIVEDMADPLNITASIDPRFKIIFSLLEQLGSEFFRERAMYKGHIAHLFITAVNKQYHGQGLSRKINFESIRLAKERNFDFMCCKFTHDYNEKGTVNHLRNSKLLIRSCKYNEFVFNGSKPFQNLDGSASAYIWELREGAKLRYRINTN
jgi:EAL domain-containing protein (putative c-di-GMP-specific phosphodiesterase class I)